MQDRETPRRTGCIIGDRIIVLDPTLSRYFMVPHDPQAPSSVPPAPDGRSPILSWPDDRPPRLDNARVTWTLAARDTHAASERSVGWSALGRLWLGEHKAQRALGLGMSAGLALLDVPLGDADPVAITAYIDASWRSLRLWSSEDRCLPRSIALARLLRKAGSPAKMVVGVTLHPFTAHAWVQEGDVVLNDTIDHAALFTPVLMS